MVYNDTYFRPASLTEKLRAKFGERTANAIFRAGSETGMSDGAVMSFFGRDDNNIKNGDRAIPTSRKTSNAAKPIANVKYARPAQQSRHAQQTRTASQSRPAQRSRTTQQSRAAQQTRTVSQSRPAQYNNRNTVSAAQMNGTFAKAYATGDRVKRLASRVNTSDNVRSGKRAPSKRDLKHGREYIPGSRHATVKTDFGIEIEKGFVVRLKESFRDTHKAEYRVKKPPLPLAYVTAVIVCAFMAMTLIFSNSQINEYNNRIGDLHAKQSELAATADKLEVKLEARDDIRTIENIAVDYIGMVNSDVAQTKFVSVSAADRVEILQTETEEKEGVFSALLSAIGESLGKVGEYFN